MAATEKTNKASTAQKTRNAKEMSATQRVLTLVGGDILSFLIFAAYGRYSHGEPVINAIPQVVLTALPFAIGWFLVAPFMGVYRRDIAMQPRAMAIRTTLAWIPGWIIALVLRGIFVDHGVPPAAFAIISFVFNLAILLLWRWPFALNNNLKSRMQP